MTDPSSFLKVMVVAAVLSAAVQPCLAQTAVLTGQVLNDRGTPAVGLRVAAIPVREGEQGMSTLVGLTLTDTSGRYVIELAEAGTYYIMAGQIDSPSFYPGVNTLQSARSVLVSVGARISDLDFKTSVPLTYSISGRVAVPQDHKIAPGSRMVLSGVASQDQPLKPDGTFAFSGLRPGLYSLRLLPEAFLFELPVEVNDRSVSDLEYPNVPIVSIKGNLIVEDAKSAPAVTLSFLDLKQNRATEVVVRESFYFFAREGELIIGVKELPNGYDVKSFTANGIDPRGRPLTLTVTEPVVDVTMTLKAFPTAAFEGQVVSPRGVAQPISNIVLKGKEGVEPLHGTARADGSFAFDHVAPGEYMASLSLPEVGQLELPMTVPAGGNPSARIVIPDLRSLSVRLNVDESVPVETRPVVTLRFAGAGTLTSLVVDGSSADSPIRFRLRDGQYLVTSSVRQSTGTAPVRVKTLVSGDVDLRQMPLQVSESSAKDLVISIGQ